GIIFEWFVDTVLVTYLAIHPDHMGRGIGKLLTEEMQTHVMPNRVGVHMILAEVEDPAYAKDKAAVKRRLKTLGSYGWRRVPLIYVQPPLRNGGEPGKGLMLVALGATEVSSIRLTSFLNEFYESLGQMDRQELVEMRLRLATTVILETHEFG